MFYVYILHSKKLGHYYVGHTDQLHRRLEEHNSGRSLYTKRGTPWRLVYTEECDTRNDAIKREKEIKRRKSSRYVAKLVQSVPSSYSEDGKVVGSSLQSPLNITLSTRLDYQTPS